MVILKCVDFYYCCIFHSIDLLLVVYFLSFRSSGRLWSVRLFLTTLKGNTSSNNRYLSQLCSSTYFAIPICFLSFFFSVLKATIDEWSKKKELKQIKQTGNIVSLSWLATLQ